MKWTDDEGEGGVHSWHDIFLVLLSIGVIIVYIYSVTR